MKDMRKLKTYYFSMVPPSHIDWENTVGSWKELYWEIQDHLLKETVNSEHGMEYKASLSYRKAFLKYIINKLEHEGLDIHDDLYKTYTELLGQNDDEGDWCYKAYYLAEENKVTLMETKQLISRGTTGLCTWQAAKYLAEWCLENKLLFADKNVLELGSGLGFTGLVVCKACQPKQFTFSDYHPEVMKILAQNIDINVKKNDFSQSEMRQSDDKLPNWLNGSNWTRPGSNDDTKISNQHNESPQGRFTDVPETLTPPGGAIQTNMWQNRHQSGVRLLQMDWTNTLRSDVESLFMNIDIVIAADVVYDGDIIPALVSILDHLLSRPGRQKLAYIASTVRNEETRNHFLASLDSADIMHQEIEESAVSVFYYDKSVPIQLLKLWKEKSL